jgi:hypothetical protein
MKPAAIEKPKPKQPELLELSEKESRMLWQLINAQGVATPLADAQVGASLYAKLRAVAVKHGHAAPNDPA